MRVTTEQSEAKADVSRGNSKREAKRAKRKE